MSDETSRKAESHDPLLSPTNARFTMFPIKYPKLWNMFKESEALFWTAEEIDLSSDPNHWKNKLNDNERHFVKHVLAFFAASDGIVNENLAIRFYNDVQSPEARAFYSMQMLIETIHSETYSLLIDTYITDQKEKTHLLEAVETMPIITKKAQWALKWLTSDASFAERLMAFAAVEGIFFSSSFCSIYWLKDRGLMPGLSFSNELISRDEGIHTDFAIMLHDHLQDENMISGERIQQIFSEAVEIECEFASESLPVSLIGMNADQMQQYIKFVADRLLQQAGADKLYHVRNPFGFMEKIALAGKTNFHERRVSEYRKTGVGFSAKQQQISFDEDF